VLRPLFWISAGIWISSFIIHVLSAFGVDLLTPLPQLMFVQAIAFLLLLLSIFFICSINPGSVTKLEWLFDSVPTAFIFLTIAGVPYSFGNFFAAGANLPGAPAQVENGYVLRNHGVFIRRISGEEFHFFQAMALRMFSGAGLAMSGIATFLFYPRNGTKKQETVEE
jgi:hypothetical protein